MRIIERIDPDYKLRFGLLITCLVVACLGLAGSIVALVVVSRAVFWG